jgi:type VI secretion system secreted protein Hcp
VTIAFVRTGTDAPQKYLEYKLEGASISGFSVSSGGDRPTESVSINFDKITMSYTPVGDDLSGSEGGFGWNLATGKKI